MAVPVHAYGRSAGAVLVVLVVGGECGRCRGGLKPSLRAAAPVHDVEEGGGDELLFVQGREEMECVGQKVGQRGVNLLGARDRRTWRQWAGRGGGRRCGGNEQWNDSKVRLVAVDVDKDGRGDARSERVFFVMEGSKCVAEEVTVIMRELERLVVYGIIERSKAL